MTEEEEIEMAECIECGTESPREELATTSNDDPICDGCLQMCDRCEDIGTTNWDWYSVGNSNSWCEGCWDAFAWTCQRCDYCYDSDRVSYSQVYGEGWDESWCEDCIGENARYCEECDQYYPDDIDCTNCGNSGEDVGTIHSYHYKPNPVFNGSSPTNLYMGFELEMELNSVTTSQYRQAVAEVSPLEADNVCYIKSDSSISGQGFELVTHPHTLGSYEQATGLWDYIELLRTKYEARSYDTDSCGLHVHVSRSAFKSGAHTHRFLSLIYKNPREMMKLAGRKNSRYAKFGDVYQVDEWGIPRFNLADKIRNGYRTERYSAVNTGNDYTLELRFFRGNMKREGVMSALELCHASVEYTRNMSLSDVRLGMLKWEWFADWVATNNGIYPNLYLRMSKVPSINLDNRPLINA